MKILLPVDGSPFTKRMLGWVAARDELFGPRHDYLAFTALAPIPGYAARFVDRAVLDEHYAEQAEAVLQPVRTFAARQGWALRTAFAPGHAAEAIAARAMAEKPELIVMGTHGHSALAGAMLGSVAAGVLARCKVPVLFVR